MDIRLRATPDEIRVKFSQLNNFTDLADLLEVKRSHLHFVLYRLPRPRYVTFDIPKKKLGSKRTIFAPDPALKNIQRRLLQVLECVYTPRCSVYGFVKKKSVVGNAKAHRKKAKLKYVLNVDLKDFFPSIHYGRVRGMFLHEPYRQPIGVAQTIARICCYDGGLPQGAPTSPIIANMICNKMDSQLQRLAQKHRTIYTRYADDITFSTTMSRFPSAIAERTGDAVRLGQSLEEILELNKFIPNLEKVRLQEWTQRQEITGIVVNRGLNVSRRYIRQIRAMLHDWETNGYDIAQKRHLEQFHQKHRSPFKPELVFKQIVKGKLEYLGMVRGKDDPVYRRYMIQLARLDSSVHIEVKPVITAKSAFVFLSYARLDFDRVKPIYDRLLAAGYKPWIDTEDIIPGEEWEFAIDRAIEQCDVFVVVLSENSVNRRGMLQKELKKALEKLEEKLPDDIFIVPLRLEKCEPKHPALNKLQWVDYFESNAWDRLTLAIQESLKRASESHDKT